MFRFFRTVGFRVRLAWAALHGKQIMFYRALLDGKPVASRIIVFGRIEAADHAVLLDCMVQNHDGKGDGFRVGDHCFIANCVATGWDGYGFNTAGQSAGEWTHPGVVTAQK
jgi:hypothetical protein